MIWNRITSSALPLKENFYTTTNGLLPQNCATAEKARSRPVFSTGEKSMKAYLSHVRVQITASRKDIYLVLVYGITEHPMMLATNKEIKSKEDVLRVARIYFSR